MRPRGTSLGLASALAIVFISSSVLAQSSRPYDAPEITDPRATIPAMPQGYIKQDDEGLSFVYHPSARERVRAVIPVALHTRARMRAQFGQNVLDKLEIRVAAVPDELRTLGPTEEIAPYAPAIAFSRHRLIITSLGSPRSLDGTDLGPVLAHAMAHVALDEMVDFHSLPLWFHEGYAAHVAGDGRGARTQVLTMAALQQRILSIADMRARFPVDAPESSVAYAHATDLARFLSDKPHQNQFSALIESMRHGERFDESLEKVYGAPISTIEDDWHRSMARRYGFLPVFLAAMGVWALCGAIIVLRRKLETRQLRSEKPSREKAPSHPEIERSPAIEMVVARAEKMPAQSRGESMGATIPMETEVPKVEHEGDWHTLH